MTTSAWPWDSPAVRKRSTRSRLTAARRARPIGADPVATGSVRRRRSRARRRTAPAAGTGRRRGTDAGRDARHDHHPGDHAEPADDGGHDERRSGAPTASPSGRPSFTSPKPMPRRADQVHERGGGRRAAPRPRAARADERRLAGDGRRRATPAPSDDGGPGSVSRSGRRCHRRSMADASDDHGRQAAPGRGPGRRIGGQDEGPASTPAATPSTPGGSHGRRRPPAGAGCRRPGDAGRHSGDAATAEPARAARAASSASSRAASTGQRALGGGPHARHRRLQPRSTA